jgi:hypothetical protein
MMHPLFSAWRGLTRRFGASQGAGRWCGHERAHCGGFGGKGRCGDEGGGEAGGGPESFFWGGGPFGVRRPLRFLAYKLGLDERQVSELAVILDGLKVERAQAELDLRRTGGAYADLLAADTFDEAAASQIAAERVRSAERVQKSVQAAVAKIHALLGEEQRRRFVYMLRTGLVRL